MDDGQPGKCWRPSGVTGLEAPRGDHAVNKVFGTSCAWLGVVAEAVPIGRSVHSVAALLHKEVANVMDSKGARRKCVEPV